MCPLPLMKLMQCHDQLQRGEHVMLIVDQVCTYEGVLAYCKKQNIQTSVKEPISGIWEITLYQKVNL